jgi:signal transduction histidine kinase
MFMRGTLAWTSGGVGMYRHIIRLSAHAACIGGVVRIGLRPIAGGYAVVVSDQGPGIPPESQPHIFERFYSVDASRRRGDRDGGAGLGLALVRWVAHLHGGDATLTASSNAGATFTVIFPASS